MKKFVTSTPVVGFLCAFNLSIAIVAGVVLEFGPQQVITCAGMGVVSLGAGIALLGRFRARRPELTAPQSVAA